MPHIETDPLLDGSWELPPSPRESSVLNHSSKKRILVLVSTLASVMILGLASHHAESDKEAHEVKQVLAATSEQGLRFTVQNAYGEARYGREHPFVGDKYVVEPHKFVRFLPVVGGTGSSSVNSYRWEIEGANGAEVSMIAFGEEVEVSFSEPGELYKVKVVAHNEQGQEVDRFESKVVSAYVKRELRRMNEHDRETFLDAAAVLWRTPTVEGRALFGAQYTGMDTFVQVHGDSATGDVQCDMWHEGTGFVTHHLALSLSFEASIRAVNPEVTTPYWDFTIDGEAIKKAGGGPSMLLEVNDFFTDKWFGSSDEDSHVADGRWAHADVVKNNGGLLKNSYGIVRAPWNNNGDTELTRHLFDVCGAEPINKPIPSCQAHASLLQKKTLGEVQTTIAGWGHGTLHVNTGGVFGKCTDAMADFYKKYEDVLSREVTLAELAQDIENDIGVNPAWRSTEVFQLKDFVLHTFHLEYFHIYRSLWRSQTCALDGQPLALECPESCDPSEPSEDCKCQCKGVNSPNFDWENLEPCLYMQDKTKWISQSALPRETRQDLVHTFCSAEVKEGEQLESASPMDIVFWMIHPVLDRLVTAKRLASQPSGIFMGSYGKIEPFEDETWLEFSSYSTQNYTCKGHGPHDPALQGLTIVPRIANAADVNGDGIITNMEFYNVMDPAVFNADYVYDNFEWAHCGQENEVSEEELLSQQTESYAAQSFKKLSQSAMSMLSDGRSATQGSR